MDILIFNLTAEVEEKFTRFRLTFSLISMLCLYLPSLLLSLTVLLSVLYSKKINGKMKIVICNIVISDIALSLTEIFRSSLPILYYTQGTGIAIYCRIGIYLYFVSTETKQFAITMYCFVMFYIVKFKAANLKRKVMLAGVAGAIVASCLWNQIIFYNNYNIGGEIGFCYVPRRSPLLITKLISLLLEGFFFTGSSMTCIIILGLYVKSAIIHTSTVKHGMLKTAVALAVISILSFITSTLPVLMATLQPEPMTMYSEEVWRKYLPQTILFPMGSWSVLVTPICLVLTLKPVRQVFSKIFTYIRCGAKKNLRSHNQVTIELNGTVVSNEN